MREDWDADRARLDMARDLREIGQLYGGLSDEAVNLAADSELPGGEAMNLLGPAASMTGWQEIFEQLEEADGDLRYVDDQVAQRHVLLVLGDWEERVRAERDQPTDLRATVPRAIDYLRKNLGWITEHFDPAPVMSREIHQCRRALENVLHEGVRYDTSAAACFRVLPGAEVDESGKPRPCGGRLVRRTLERRSCPHVDRAIEMSKGVVDPVTVLRQTLLAFPEDEQGHRACDQGGRDDLYECVSCGGYYTEAEYWLAVKEHYEREAG